MYLYTSPLHTILPFASGRERNQAACGVTSRARGVPGGVAPHSPLHRFMWLSSWSPIENCSVGSARAGRVDINRKKALFLNFFSSDIFNIPLAVAVEILGNGKTEKELNKNKKKRSTSKQASKRSHGHR